MFQNNCYCVCCDKDNNYYVTDIVTHTVSIHDAQGRIRKRFGFEGKWSRVYPHLYDVIKYSLVSEYNARVNFVSGTSMIHFNQPVALVINSKNRLFITDSQNHCIKVCSFPEERVLRGLTLNISQNPNPFCPNSSFIPILVSTSAAIWSPGTTCVTPPFAI